MRRKSSGVTLRIFAIVAVFVTAIVPLLNAINVFAKVPEGLIANTDDDSVVVGEIDTSRETTYGSWKINTSNLYSGKMERGDVVIQNLKIADATLEEHKNGTPVADSEKYISKETTDNGGHRIIVTQSFSDSSTHNLIVIFSNAVKVISTGELLDLEIYFGVINNSASYTLLEDCPEDGYRSLAVGAPLLGASWAAARLGVYFTLRTFKHGTNDFYSASPLNFLLAVYDLDMPDLADCPALDDTSWNSPYAEVAEPIYNYNDENRIYTINGANISGMAVDGNSHIMVTPAKRNFSCSDIERDSVSRTLEAGFIIKGRLDEQPGYGMLLFGNTDTQKVVDFGFDFPTVTAKAEAGGTISGKDKTVERSFGETYTVTVTPDNGNNIKKISIKSDDNNVTDFTLDDFLANTATQKGSVVTLSDGVVLKYKGNGVVNIILPKQYMLKTGEVKQGSYNNYTITASFEGSNNNNADPNIDVPNTSSSNDVENPNTADSILASVITLGISVAILAYRKHRRA